MHISSFICFLHNVLHFIMHFIRVSAPVWICGYLENFYTNSLQISTLRRLHQLILFWMIVLLTPNAEVLKQVLSSLYLDHMPRWASNAESSAQNNYYRLTHYLGVRVRFARCTSRVNDPNTDREHLGNQQLVELDRSQSSAEKRTTNCLETSS